MANSFGKDPQARVRALGVAMINFGRGTLKVLDAVYRGFAFFADGLAGIIETLVDISVKYLQVTQPMDAVLAKIDPTGHFKKSADAHWNLLKSLEATSRELHAFGGAAEGAWQGNTVLTQAIGGLTKTLDAAERNLGATVTGLTSTGAAATGATKPLQDFGAATGVAAKETATFRRSLAALARDTERGLASLSDVDFEKEFGERLRNAAREMEKFGIVGTAIPDAVRRGLERLNAIDLSGLLKELRTATFAIAEAQRESFGKEQREQLERGNAATIDALDGVTAARRDAAETAGAIEDARAAYAIDVAQRLGATAAQLAAMESQRARARLRRDLAAEDGGTAPRPR